MSVRRRLLSGTGAVMLAAATLTAVAWGPGSIASADPAPCHISPCSFASTGAEQTFIVPAGVISITATAVGAPGGAEGQGLGGGRGGSITGKIKVTAGQTLYVEVGTAGKSVPFGPSDGAGGTAGASLSGGNGGYAAAGGGGASDIRTVSAAVVGSDIGTHQAHDVTASLNSRLIIAAGGGGAGMTSGGDAGAPGANGAVSTGGGAGGGAGGPAGAGSLPGTDGTLGIGGSGGNRNNPGGGGGGGGFYGGGGGGAIDGNDDGSGGGGGSSAIDTGSGLALVGASATSAAPSINLSWIVTPPAVSTVTLASSNATQLYGTSSVTLTATVHVAGPQAGSIVFNSGGTTLAVVAESTGTAVFPVPAGTAVGDASFTVTFVPADMTTVLWSASAGVIVTVVAPSSVVSLTANKSTQKVGVSTVVLTAGVSVNDQGTIVGSVVFKRGSQLVATVSVAGGKATFKVPANVGVGKYVFAAVFTSSRAGVAGSTSNAVTITVVK